MISFTRSDSTDLFDQLVIIAPVSLSVEESALTHTVLLLLLFYYNSVPSPFLLNRENEDLDHTIIQREQTIAFLKVKSAGRQTASRDSQGHEEAVQVQNQHQRTDAHTKH